MSSTLTAPVRPATATTSRLRPQPLLAVVAVAFAIVQFVVVTPRIYLGWDEAVYLSQVAPGVPPMVMTAPRAFGTVLLAAPAALFTSSVAVIRLYFMALSGLGVFLAYRPWLRAGRPLTVPAAALVFCSLWVSIFYGNEVMPNVATACCAVAAVGYFRAADTWPTRGALVAAFGLMALIRPLDALWIALPLGPAALLHRSWRRPGIFAAVALGLAVGWVPWIVESYLRFGGPLARYRLIDAENGNGLHVVLLRQLQGFSAGTIQCMPRAAGCGAVGFAGVFAWTLLGGLTALALWRSRRPETVLAVGVALAFAAPYLLCTGIANPRFLLPSYALLALAAAAALADLARAHAAGPAVAGIVLGIFVAGQLGTAAAVVRHNQRLRLRQTQVAAQLHRLGIRPPCVVYGSGAAAIGYATGCTARPILHGLPRTPARTLTALPGGVQVVVLGHKPLIWPGWHRLQGLPGHHWYAYVRPMRR